MSPADADQILVPIGETATMRNTVGYVVREAMERLDADETGVAVHFVYPVVWDKQDLEGYAGEDEEELLERVEAWAREDAGIDDESLPFEMTTAVIGADQYLFSPVDYAELLVEYAEAHALNHIILDPEFQPGPSTPMLTPLLAELERVSGISYEESPVQRSVRGRQLLGRSFSVVNFLAVFGLSYLFYLVIGGFAGTFDYATGAVSAGIVAALLSSITLNRSLKPLQTITVLARFIVYVPFLLWEISKANLQVAYIVLHPSLPINPSMERIVPALPRGLPVTTLANSITLTPGTVTVDVREREFHVHALSDAAREGLHDGTLERAVRFVFFGRSGARMATSRERGEGEEVDPE